RIVVRDPADEVVSPVAGPDGLDLAPGERFVAAFECLGEPPALPVASDQAGTHHGLDAPAPCADLVVAGDVPARDLGAARDVEDLGAPRRCDDNRAAGGVLGDPRERRMEVVPFEPSPLIAAAYVVGEDAHRVP